MLDLWGASTKDQVEENGVFGSWRRPGNDNDDDDDDDDDDILGKSYGHNLVGVGASTMSMYFQC